MTYLTLNAGEIRLVELAIRNADEMTFVPVSASVYFRNKDEDITEELVTTCSSNVVTCRLVCPSTAGNYSIVWNIFKDTQKYIHETKLTILEL